MSRFESIARSYLSRFQAAVINARRAGAKSVELATRPVVHDFVEKLVRLHEPNPLGCIVHHDTRATRTDRPDWRLEDKLTFGVYAYGDHKDLADAKGFVFSSGEKKQFYRYLELGRPVFVFDGIELILLQPDTENPFKEAIRKTLIPKSSLTTSDWSKALIDRSFEDCFKQLLSSPGFQKWSEEDLVAQLARRARLIAEVVVDMLDAPIGTGRDAAEQELIKAIHELQYQLSAHYDPTLTGKQSCADFVAQALVFGMFYAHTQAPDHGSSVDERRQIIETFWTEATFSAVAVKLRPFHTISTLLHKALSSENDLRVWYDDASNMLAHAEYQGTKGEPADFHTLFERFLTAFKPKMRFDYGAWYTPKELTHWTIAFADSLSQRAFAANLAESVDRVIDPCVGTGGFLEAFIVSTASESGLKTQLVGLEILPAPYSLAHYRLAKVAKGTRFENQIDLFLTDTLADQIVSPPAVASNGFEQELIMASKSAKPPIRLVVGNPPSSLTAPSSAPRLIIDKLLNDFRPPINERGARQNIQKAINNEAYRFLRWSAERVLAADRGILALVLPGSFIRNVSLRHARKWLQSRFEEIWVLELDDDARNGAGTESLFNVQQGRAAVFAIRGNGISKGVYFRSIARSDLGEKKSYLRASPSLTDFEAVHGESGMFAPASSGYPEEVWKASWPLTSTLQSTGIYQAKCSGVKLAPTSVLFHTDRLMMERRSSAIGRSPLKPWDEIFTRWFSGQQKPPKASKMTNSVRGSVADAVSKRPESLIRYTYRPFIEGYALIDDVVFANLADSDGKGTRKRPEIRAAFAAGAAALCIAPSPRDLGSSLGRIASFAWHVPDNDNVTRGNAMVYPDRFPLQRMGGHCREAALAPNVTSLAAAYFNGFKFPERAALFYVYAVLSCPSYLNSFEPVLYVSSDPSQPFRVPLAKDIKIRASLVELGQCIAECESSSSTIKVSSRLEVEWPRKTSGFKLEKDLVDQISGSISLLDEDQNTIVLVKGVTARCLSENISGHHILTRWLRERTYAYIRREFRNQDLDEFLQLVSRIEAQHGLIDKADKYVAALIAAGVHSLVPSSVPRSSGVAVELSSSLSGAKGKKMRKRS